MFVYLVTIGSDNGLSPIRCQAIIYTSARILPIGSSAINFGEILIKILIKSLIKTFYSRICTSNIVCKMAVISSTGRWVKSARCTFHPHRQHKYLWRVYQATDVQQIAIEREPICLLAWFWPTWHPRNVGDLLCSTVLSYRSIYPYSSGLFRWKLITRIRQNTPPQPNKAQESYRILYGIYRNELGRVPRMSRVGTVMEISMF